MLEFQTYTYKLLKQKEISKNKFPQSLDPNECKNYIQNKNIIIKISFFKCCNLNLKQLQNIKIQL